MRLTARSWLRWLVAVGLLLGVGSAALLWGGRQSFAGSQISVEGLREPLERQTEGGSGSESESVEPLKSVRTVLVLGGDTGEVDEEYGDVATGERGGNRTDTIMLLRVDPDAGEVTGIGIPRDLYIPLCNGGTDRINAAYSLGGPDCVIDTVREFSGVDIDHYIEVDFGGFIEIVDAIGGVTMYLDDPMKDPDAHLDLSAGCVTLDGRDALGFVRSRKTDSDFGRIARQQRFLKELAEEATSLQVLANPVRLLRLIEAIGGAVTMDDQLDIRTLQRFAVTLRDLGPKDITMGTVPTATDNSTGSWHEIPIEADSEALFEAFEKGHLADYLRKESADGRLQPASSTAGRTVQQADGDASEEHKNAERPKGHKDC